MMKRLLAVAILACMPNVSIADTVTVQSARSVPESVDRLRAFIENAGANVFTVVDFGGGVKSIGEDIGDIQLVVFGDARIGFKALSVDPMAALVLPGKVLVYDTDSGAEMAYEVPADMLAKTNIPPDAPVVQKMAETLDRITRSAAQ